MRVGKACGVGLVVVMALAGLTGQASAATMAPDFRDAGPFQPVHTRSGDFDGDGRRDTVSLVNEGDSGRIAVHVLLDTVTGFEDIRVTSFDASAASGLRIVPAGSYRIDCGDFSSDCAAESIETHSDSLIVAADDKVSVLLHWQGGAFEPEFVQAEAGSPEDALSRVASVLYAVR